MTATVSNPWEAPLDESYWHVLLNEVERATPPAEHPYRPARTGASSHSSTVDEEEMATTSNGGDVTATAWDKWDHEPGNLAMDWERAAHLFEAKEPVDLEVVGCNRGGLLVRFGEIQGFVPASQLLKLPRELSSQARQSELARRIGSRLYLQVIELDCDRNRLILSERVAANGRDAESFLASLTEGDVYTGRVTNLCGFGAFVDLGGMEGLVHISELSWGRVNHPADVVKPGDQIEVYVMGIEPEQQRVALSLKRLKPDPWTLVDEQYEVGQLIEAEITNVVNFGAFARVDEGLEGLIHISELAEGNFLHPRNVVKEGDRVVARVLNIDSANHRLGLSLRQAHDHDNSY